METFLQNLPDEIHADVTIISILHNKFVQSKNTVHTTL
jgi:hypothetical protein